MYLEVKQYGGSASGVVDFAKQFVGEGHSRFTSFYNIEADWCAIFVSYCFENCKLIPDVLPSKYFGCSDEVRALRAAGKFREARSGYVPKPGDIIFFVDTGGDLSGHTGIVSNCDGVKVYTIEGNTANKNWRQSLVTEKDYALNSYRILGYMES